MEKLKDFLRQEWTSPPPLDLLEIQLTVTGLKELIRTPEMNVKNLERFVYKWCDLHKDSRDIFEMWDLYTFQKFGWDDRYLNQHLQKLDKYGLLDEQV